LSFKPYTYRTERLPIRKAGEILQIAGSFYEIREVRITRQQITLTAGVSDQTLNVATSSTYEPIVGNIKKSRVVHLQYLACSTTDAVYLKWQENPLLSRAANLPLNSNLANLESPYEVNKWSYDDSMCLKYSLAAGLSQTLTIEAIEYFVAPYKGTPEKYLEITADGEAVFHG